MKNIFRGVASVIFLLLFHLTYAQSTLIKGLIKDKHGVPLIGATVRIDNKKSGVITDLSGHYTMKLKPGRHSIAVSYIGFAEQLVYMYAWSGKSIERNFIMTEVYKSCSEVVVVSSYRNKRDTSPAEIKNTEAIVPPRQFDLLLINSIFQH